MKTYNKRYLLIFLSMLIYWLFYGLIGLWMASSKGKDIFSNSIGIGLAFHIQMFGFISFIASDMFKDLGLGIQRSGYYLMMPFTALEKIGVKFLISAVLFWPVFFAMSFIGLAVLWNIIYPIAVSQSYNGVLVSRTFDIVDNIHTFSTISMILNAFLLHSIFIVSSVSLKRFKFITTLLAVIVVYVVFRSLDFSISEKTYLTYPGIVITTIFLWIFAYYKLKKYFI
ncbi:hypothetical protein OWR28_14485 [Chryseobacterium sp. 1B4]